MAILSHGIITKNKTKLFYVVEDKGTKMHSGSILTTFSSVCKFCVHAGYD